MQEIIVILIGVFTVGFIGWKVYKLLSCKPNYRKCDTCGYCVKEFCELTKHDFIKNNILETNQ